MAVFGRAFLVASLARPGGNATGIPGLRSARQIFAV
jgi:hypothetical protein